jgi:hypothetical protein
MNCERIRQQIPECLAGRLDQDGRDVLVAHLETCPACRGEMAQLGAVWRGMQSINLPEPDPAMRSRFIEVLEAYQAGMQQAQERPIVSTRRSRWVAGWWPARAVWQTALAVLLLVAGGFGGRYLAEPHGTAVANPEMAQLKGQVESLRQLVAMSLLQDQTSPSSRIRGASYFSQIAQPDREMKDALLHTVNHDPNLNVRLSAVDALERFAANPDVRRALIDAISVQDSPLVQIALIDLLAQIDARDAVPALQKVALDSQADREVRQRAEWALQKMGVSK